MQSKARKRTQRAMGQGGNKYPDDRLKRKYSNNRITRKCP